MIYYFILKKQENRNLNEEFCLKDLPVKEIKL